MFATTLIVFRETLEAALFVGIVAAATRGLPQRSRWLAGGVLAGIAGAIGLAAGAEQIGNLADGIGQDLVNVAILSVAFSMLAWHCIWVSTHGRDMALDARRVGVSVSKGSSAPWALTVAVALAVLREGAETVLFVAGLNAGSNNGLQATMTSVSAGLAGGALVGTAIYLGLSKVKPQHLFAVTNALILLLAASIASQLARALAQSGLVQYGTSTLWDVSHLLPTDSPLGSILHALVGYDAQPSGLQLVFYVGALAAIAAATRAVRKRQSASPPALQGRPAPG